MPAPLIFKPPRLYGIPDGEWRIVSDQGRTRVSYRELPDGPWTEQTDEEVHAEIAFRTDAGLWLETVVGER